MSRYDSDQDLSDYLDGPHQRFNTRCTDCGDPFTKGRDDVGSLCDGCCDERDAWATAYKARMAKASLPAIAKRKDVA